MRDNSWFQLGIICSNVWLAQDANFWASIILGIVWLGMAIYWTQRS